MSWDRFKKYFFHDSEMDFSLDISKISFTDKQFLAFSKKFDTAFEAMKVLEKGAVANPDEGRMVGHYWLRDSRRAPKLSLRKEIDSALKDIISFSKKISQGKIKGQKGVFKNLLVVGIGGSTLGPQLVDGALKGNDTGLKAHFFDNTDPDGIDRVIASLQTELAQTLVCVISKSGGTQETRNGMLEIKNAYAKAKLNFEKHAVAVTGEGSKLDQLAKGDNWLETFPMWDWVGGRTSLFSAVGLLPAALSGYHIEAMLKGAAAMDRLTRVAKPLKNPAALLAFSWYQVGKGRGEKDMVILPYKDRLELMSRYLQQLVMESIGKEKNLAGKKVNQGIAVYGNKGSTDQHAYIQQLRDGLNNFFVTFIEVKKSRKGSSIDVAPGVSSGDYLEGFYLGTRKALKANKRESVSLTIKEVNEETLGSLIAIYERAVGLYATMVGVNAYHQPGVEAGKKAAESVVELKKELVKYIRTEKNISAEKVAKGMGEDDVEMVFKLFEYMSANTGSGVRKVKSAGVKSLYSGSRA